MIYPNTPLYLLSLLGYIYYLTYYTLTTKDNIDYLFHPFPFSVFKTHANAFAILKTGSLKWPP